MVLHGVTAFGESFRGSVVGFAVVGPGSVYSEEIGAGDVIVVSLTDDQPFVRGFEVTLNIPTGSSGFPGNYAVHLYRRVDAPNTSGPATIVGQQVASWPITAGGRQFLVVPFDQERSRLSAANTRVADTVDAGEDLPMAVQLVPIMKGMNAAVASQRLPLQIKPILASVGGLVVDINPPDNEIEPSSLRVTVDGWPVPAGEVVELDPGIYPVTISSPEVVDQHRNVGIEAGRLTRVAFALERPMARVRLTVPSVAQVLMDGRSVNQETLTLNPGEHTLLIRLGDYSLSRKILLEGESDYEIGLSLDIFVRKD
jgi:hypothetical protein